MIRVTDTIAIEEKEIEIEYVRSSGPGGQNVNKVATAAQLRFDARRSPSLADDVRERLIRLAGARASSEGVIVIDARRYRTQNANREDAIHRLVELIRKASHRPKKRKKTRPTAASRERRLRDKQRRGAVKRDRSRIDDD